MRKMGHQGGSGWVGQWLVALLALVCVMATPAAAQPEAKEQPASVSLSNFLKVGETRWRGPRGITAKAVEGWNSQTPGAQVTYGIAGSYSVHVPEGIVTVGQYKWLSFWAKGDGQARSAYFYLREGTAESWDQFYAAFQVEGDDWRYYVVDLSAHSREPGPIHHLKTRFTKNSEGTPTDKKLTPGNAIFVVTLHVAQADSVLVLSDLQAHVDYPRKPAAPGQAGGEPADAAAVDKPAQAGGSSRKAAGPAKDHYAFDVTSSPGAITLADQGRSDFSVVIPASPSATQAFAAQELQRYIQQATGAKLPIVESDRRPAGPALFVGTDLKRWGLDEARYTGKDSEGFALAGVDDRTLVITGGSERGMIFGVYAFLEKAVEVRFFRPMMFGEIVPSHASLKLPLFKDQEEPVFGWRRNHYCSDTRVISNQRRYDIADWSVKNRYNVELERLRSPRSPAFSTPEAFYALRGGVIPLAQEWQGHNFHKLIPPSQYFESNPEFFPYEHATGKRRAERAQLCMTNTQVHRIIADKAIAYFREHPDLKMLYVCQEDGSRLWCQCPSCLELNPSKSPSEQYLADQNIHLANSIAQLVAKEFPDRIIGTYAYTVTRRPPVNVKPLANVRVMYCGFAPHADKSMPAPEQVAEMEQWGRLIPSGVIMYEYLYSGPIYRNTSDAWLKDNYQFYTQNNVVGIIHETREAWGVEGFKMYAAPRLAWNPDLDIDALEKDYYSRMYGKAAKVMFEFDRKIQDYYFDRSRFVSVRHSTQTRMTPEDLKGLDNLLRQAFLLAADDATRARISYQQLSLQYVKLFNEMVVSVLDLEDSLDVVKAGRAQRAVNEVIQFVSMYYPTEVISNYDLRQAAAFQNQIGRVVDEVNAIANYSKGTKSFTELPHDGWVIKLDPELQGDDQKWYTKALQGKDVRPIRIAEHWEKQGIQYDGVAWYQREIEIPASFTGRNASLVFMGVDERAWVYLDGQLVGSHAEGDVGKLWVTPFVIDLTGHAKPGQTQRLTVRVHDSAAAGGIWKSIYLRSE